MTLNSSVAPVDFTTPVDDLFTTVDGTVIYAVYPGGSIRIGEFASSWHDDTANAAR